MQQEENVKASIVQKKGGGGDGGRVTPHSSFSLSAILRQTLFFFPSLPFPSSHRGVSSSPPPPPPPSHLPWKGGERKRRRLFPLLSIQSATMTKAERLKKTSHLLLWSVASSLSSARNKFVARLPLSLMAVVSPLRRRRRRVVGIASQVNDFSLKECEKKTFKKGVTLTFHWEDFSFPHN